MRGILRIVRDGEVKLTLPGPSITIKADGTIWMSGSPILGITDPVIKAQVAADIKAHRFDRIPTDAYTRLGDNPNGLWAGDDDMWQSHPAKIAQDKDDAERRAIKARTVKIYLSSRGWGDYSPVEWHGDITRPDADIVTECKYLLATNYDVDNATQSDEQILDKIIKARAHWQGKDEREAKAAAEYQADIQHKIGTGYCFYCESWCDGDCGHYSNDPMIKYWRDLNQAVREQNYGINEG